MNDPESFLEKIHTGTVRLNDKAPQTLKEGCRALQGKCQFWLSAGTLLGIYRDGKLIPHDSDLDVGLLGPVREEDITRDMKKAGFNVLVQQFDGDQPSQLAYFKDGNVFDIYVFQKEGEELVNRTKHGTMRKPAKLFERHDRVSLDGEEYPTPSPVEEYLEVRYGKDWRTPKTEKAIWTEDAANLDT